jgi:hypothetical protein
VPDLSGLAVLGLQSILLASGSLRIVRRFAPTTDRVAFAVAVQVVALAQICAITLALGYSGLLSSSAIVAFHVALWLGTRYAVGSPAGAEPRGARAWLEGRVQPAHAAAVGLGLIVVSLALTGVFSENLVHDSLSYRVSRIGYWLQQASVRHFPTNESRQNFSAIDADLVMLWFTHPFASGFPLVTLAQSWGGALLLSSTWGAAASIGLGWRGRAGAALLVLGMPCVFVQFMTSQNDLVTAGLFSAFAYLWLRARATDDWPWPAGLALALAIGAKGTVFYVAPAAVLAALVAAGSLRGLAVRVRRHAVAFLVSLVLLAAPRYVENQLAYGNPFAPAEAYELNHGPTGLATLPRKMALNTASYGAQALEPGSNPAVLAPLVRPLFRAIVERLPDGDPFSIAAYPRRTTLTALSLEPLRNADTVSTGVLAPLLAVLGAVIAGMGWAGRTPGEPRLVVAAAVCAAGFLACFSALYLWWPSSFRFSSLVAPFLALAAAWGLERLRARARALAWIVAAGLSVSLMAEVYLGTANAGWRTIPPVEVRWLFYRDLVAERAIVAALPPSSTLAVALPYNTVLAGFFWERQRVRVRFVTSEAVSRAGDAESILRESGLDALVARPGMPVGGRPPLLLGDPASPFLLFTADGTRGVR